MKTTKYQVLSAVIGVVVCAFVCKCQGQPVERVPQSCCWIAPTDGSESPRALIMFEIPEEISCTRPFMALLEVSFTGVAQSEPVIGTQRVVEVEIVPVARAWDALTVSWDSPWAEPGGDAIHGWERSVMIWEGVDQAITVDVTPLVRAWVCGRFPNHGLLLRAASDLGGTFSLASRAEKPIVLEIMPHGKM